MLIISEKLFFNDEETDGEHGRGQGKEGLRKGIWKGRRERSVVVTLALLGNDSLL